MVYKITATCLVPHSSPKEITKEFEAKDINHALKSFSLYVALGDRVVKVIVEEKHG